MNLSGRSGAPSQPDGASMIPGPHHLSLSPGCVCELTRHLHKNEHIITYTSTTYQGRAGLACRTDDGSLCTVLPYAATARGCVEGQVPLRRKVARLRQMLGKGERLCKHHVCAPPGRTFCRPASASFLTPAAWRVGSACSMPPPVSLYTSIARCRLPCNIV